MKKEGGREDTKERKIYRKEEERSKGRRTKEGSKREEGSHEKRGGEEREKIFIYRP